MLRADFSVTNTELDSVRGFRISMSGCDMAGIAGGLDFGGFDLDGVGGLNFGGFDLDGVGKIPPPPVFFIPLLISDIRSRSRPISIACSMPAMPVW